jgi:HlyD family secretion protein
LLPGMTAYVTIGVQQREDVLRVPNAALRFKPSDGVDKGSEPGGERPAGDKSADKAGEKSGDKAGAGPGKGRKRDGQSGTVYVLDGEKIRPVSVQLGITDNRHSEVLGGDLKAGEQVVIGENAPTAGKPSSVGVRMF